MPDACPACGHINSSHASACLACGRPFSTAHRGDHAADPERHTVVLPSPFVGRRREMAILEARLDDALAGRGGLAILVGEAGIGKTQIARQFAARANHRGVLVAIGGCREDEWQRAYACWVDALGQCASTLDPAYLESQLGPEAAPLAQLVPQIREVLPNLPVPPTLDPEEERIRLYDAVAKFLLTVAREIPLVVVLDDLHWADRDSVRLLRYIARYLVQSRILLIGACRQPELRVNPGHPLIDTLAALRCEPGYEHIAVSGLRCDDVVDYLRQISGVAWPTELVTTIYQETDGNPFYVREFVRHLAEADSFSYGRAPAIGALELARTGVPAGVKQVLDRRLARLSERTRELLLLGACFTQGFQLRTLQAATEWSEEAVLSCLDEALEAGFIRVTATHPPTYDFVHAIVRNAVLEGMNPDRRVRLHRRIALALEQAHSDCHLEHAAELASQYHASASLPGASRGVPYALAAAEDARTRYAHELTAKFLRMALSLSAESEPTARTDILCKLAVAEAEAMMLREAAESARRALDAMAQAKTDPRAQAEFLERVARALKDAGAGSELWAPLVESGLALIGQQHDLLWARLQLLRDRFETISGGPFASTRWLGYDPLAVAIARAEGNEDDYARTLSPMEWRGRAETEALLALIRTWQNPVPVMRALGVVVRDLTERHFALREAMECYEQLVSVAERCGSVPGKAEALFQLAATQILLGDFETGQQTALRAYELIARLGSEHRLRTIEPALALEESYYLDNHWSALLENGETYLATTAGKWGPHGLTVAAHAALVCTRTGRKDEAEAILKLITPIVATLEPRMYLQNVVVTVAATAVWHLEAVDYAETYLKLILELTAAGVCGGPIAPAELTAARMASLLKDLARSAEYFSRARRLADRMGLRHLRAIIDYDEALTLVRSGAFDRRQVLAMLDNATAVFETMGMTGWRSRAQELRNKVLRRRRHRLSEALRPKGLSDREIEVLRLLALGRTNKDIARRLVLSRRTVDHHVANIYDKIGVQTRVEATAYAIANGIINVPPTRGTRRGDTRTRN